MRKDGGEGVAGADGVFDFGRNALRVTDATLTDEQSPLVAAGQGDEFQLVFLPQALEARDRLEAGASEALPVVNTPEEADRLKELGYR